MSPKKKSSKIFNKVVDKVIENDDDALLQEAFLENASATLSSPTLSTPPSLTLLPFEQENFPEESASLISEYLRFIYNERRSLYDAFISALDKDLKMASNREELYSASNRLLGPIDEATDKALSKELLKRYTDHSMAEIRYIAEKAIAKPPLPESISNDLSDFLSSLRTITMESIKSWLDSLWTLLEQLFSYNIPESHYTKICEAYFIYGFSSLLASSNELDEEKYVANARAQASAAFIALFARGWKSSPDAILLRGMTYYFRGYTSEAVHDISFALKCKAKHKWAMPMAKDLAESFLKVSRDGLPPCIGNFVEVDANSCVGSRYAAGFAQHGSKLYVFGGLNRGYHKKWSSSIVLSEDELYAKVVADIKESYLFRKSVDNQLNDLNEYDFLTEKWRRVEVNGFSPSPRGYCRIKINPEDGNLWMAAGRSGYYCNMNPRRDMWCFTFSTSKWKMIGSRVPFEEKDVVADAIYKSRWIFILVDDSSALCVMGFDLKTHKWFAIQSNNSPNTLSYKERSSSWLHENRLYLWHREVNNGAIKKEDDSTSELRMLVWSADISDINGRHLSLLWTSDTISGSAKDPSKFKGVQTIISPETAACVDPITGKVFIYGGWIKSLNLVTVDQFGGRYMLQGRYLSLLLELDMTHRTIRVVETARQVEGPGNRAMSMMGAFNNRILITGGYTMADERELSYEDISCFQKEWMIMLLPDDRNGDKVEPKLKEKSPSSHTAVNSTANKASPKAKMTTVHQMDISETCLAAMNEVLRDPMLRKLVSEIHPIGVEGCIFAPVFAMDNFRALSINEIFSRDNLHFVGIERIRKEYPWYPATDRDWRFHATGRGQFSPKRNVFVFFYVPPHEKMRTPGGFGQWGYYSRWAPGIQYLGNHSADEGKVVRSQEMTEKTTPNASTSKSKPDHLESSCTEICTNSKCPHLEAFQCAENKKIAEKRSGKGKAGVSQESPGNELLPKLNACGGCRLKKYCSKECQQADWPNHKAFCRSARPRTK